MPAFTTDFDEIESEIRAVPITYDQMAPPERQRLSPRDQETAAQMIPLIHGGGNRVLNTLRFLARKYPNSPAVLNNLLAATTAAGKRKDARALQERLVRDFPDYLFGRTNMALSIVEDDARLHEVPQLLGETLRLRDLKPDTKVFHVSELRSYYQAVAVYHLRSGRVELAARIHEVLVDLVGKDDFQLENLWRRILAERVSLFQRRLRQDEEKSIKVKVPELPAASEITRRERPAVHHPEVEILYEREWDMSDAEIEALLALPQETLVEDLRAVIRDCRERSPLFVEEEIAWNEEGSFFPIHALLLLGELRATEALGDVLDLLAMPARHLDLWFGDLLSEDLWIALFHLLRHDPKAVLPWMKSPGVSAKTRGIVAATICEISAHEPDRREEILSWNRDVLEFLLNSPPQDNILDTELINQLVHNLCNMGAVELRDLIAAHYDRGHISAGWHGTMDEIEFGLTQPLDTSDDRVFLPLNELYQDLQGKYSEESGAASDDEDDGEEDEEDSDMAWLPPAQSPPTLPPSRDVPFFGLGDWHAPQRPQIVVGRNDPCPCGSGMKYKKCCGAA